MTNKTTKTFMRLAFLGTAIATLTACEQGGGLDFDLRNFGQGGFSTSAAARNASSSRPEADARGIISYPGYQVAVARRGDTVESVAARVGLPAAELASYNAVQPGAPLRQNEVLALPRRVAEPGAVTGINAGGATSGAIDVSTIASGAIDRAEAGNPPSAAGSTATPAAAKPITAPAGPEPTRHKVVRGETAYSIARSYDVNVRALADWNGLGNDLAVREGQILLIPVSAGRASVQETVTAPGEGSPTPTPPSAAKPLPAETPAAASEPVKTPPAPDLGTTSSSKLSMPVNGKIIRGYQKGKYEGIDIAAAAGAPVGAAGDGVIAAITKDTKQVPIIVIRHGDPKDKKALLTVYANVDKITVKKGDKVKRGQPIAAVRASDPAFMHFEVRLGVESTDPMSYLTQ
jgi:murein DD-endopeptidase MepM/ murein hydrolase activator NlpD